MTLSISYLSYTYDPSNNDQITSSVQNTGTLSQIYAEYKAEIGDGDLNDSQVLGSLQDAIRDAFDQLNLYTSSGRSDFLGDVLPTLETIISDGKWEIILTGGSPGSTYPSSSSFGQGEMMRDLSSSYDQLFDSSFGFVDYADLGRVVDVMAQTWIADSRSSPGDVTGVVERFASLNMPSSRSNTGLWADLVDTLLGGLSLQIANKDRFQDALNTIGSYRVYPDGLNNNSLHSSVMVDSRVSAHLQSWYTLLESEGTSADLSSLESFVQSNLDMRQLLLDKRSEFGGSLSDAGDPSAGLWQSYLINTLFPVIPAGGLYHSAFDELFTELDLAHQSVLATTDLVQPLNDWFVYYQDPANTRFGPSASEPREVAGLISNVVTSVFSEATTVDATLFRDTLKAITPSGTYTSADELKWLGNSLAFGDEQQSNSMLQKVLSDATLAYDPETIVLLDEWVNYYNVRTDDGSGGIFSGLAWSSDRSIQLGSAYVQIGSVRVALYRFEHSNGDPSLPANASAWKTEFDARLSDLLVNAGQVPNFEGLLSFLQRADSSAVDWSLLIDDLVAWDESGLLSGATATNTSSFIVNLTLINLATIESSIGPPSDSSFKSDWKTAFKSVLDRLEESAADATKFETLLPYLKRASADSLDDLELIGSLIDWRNYYNTVNAGIAADIDAVLGNFSNTKLAMAEATELLGSHKNTNRAAQWAKTYAVLLKGITPHMLSSGVAGALSANDEAAFTELFGYMRESVNAGAPGSVDNVEILWGLQAWLGYHLANGNTATSNQIAAFLTSMESSLGYPYKFIANVAIEGITGAMTTKQGEIDELMAIYQASVDIMEWEQELLNTLRGYANDADKDLINTGGLFGSSNNVTTTLTLDKTKIIDVARVGTTSTTVRAGTSQGVAYSYNPTAGSVTVNGTAYTDYGSLVSHLVSSSGANLSTTKAESFMKTLLTTINNDSNYNAAGSGGTHMFTDANYLNDSSMSVKIAQSNGSYTVIVSNVDLRVDAALKYMGINFEDFTSSGETYKIDTGLKPDGTNDNTGGTDGLTSMESDDSFDKLLEAVTTEIDSQSTLSELQMLDLNTAITEFSELNSAAASIVDSIQQALQAIAANTKA